MRRTAVVALAACVALAGCAASIEPPSGPASQLRPVAYDDLPGWRDDRVAELLPAFLHQCHRLALLTPDTALGGAGSAQAAGGKVGNWAPFCAAVKWVPPGDDAAARKVIAAWLQAYSVSDRGNPAARFTGYFEPEVPGSLFPDATHTVPVYRLPKDPRARQETRAQIDQGALHGRGLAIAWLTSPVDLFFLQLQGSGRVRLRSGQIIRLSYAGRNDQPYVPLGRVLVQQGDLAADAVSMQSIRAWLTAHPSQAQTMMEQNPDYVFFRLENDLLPDQGPIGALGVALHPLRSLAIDRKFLPLAAPVWVDTTIPDGRRLQRLMLAQDLGTDITGPTRADIFFGWGDEAASLAGAMHAGGSLAVLLPRPPYKPTPASAQSSDQ
ncbi:murein transglycosylase A [Lichenicoccus sp.]|uniref:murein transglycosylase A n=1 Tax=Lichenicoccus sp. TaxID=2781899 RepID=UPI003D0A08A9